MAKIVDKTKKRREIALSCKDLLIQKGIKKVSVAEFAKAADIGKGTIYEYFKNKEDIVLEILKILSDEYYEEMVKRMQNKDELEKLNIFFEFFVKKNDDLTKIYKEFLAINLSENRFIEFHTFLNKTYLNLLESIVKNKNLATILLNYLSGFFLQKETTLKNDEFLGFEIYKILKEKL